MNEKLQCFNSFDAGIRAGRTSGRTGKQVDERLVIISVRTQTRDGRKHTPELSFSLHPRAVEQAGWQPGDHVAWRYEAGAVVMFRHAEGRAVGKTGASKRARVKCRILPEAAECFADKDAVNVEIDAGRIAFDMADIDNPADLGI